MRTIFSYQSQHRRILYHYLLHRPFAFEPAITWVTGKEREGRARGVTGRRKKKAKLLSRSRSPILAHIFRNIKETTEYEADFITLQGTKHVKISLSYE